MGQGVRMGGNLSKYLLLTGQIIAAAAFWTANSYYPRDYLQNAFYTFLALAILYLVFKIILDDILIRPIKDPKIRYSARKGISVVYILAFVAVLIAIWAVNTEALLVSYGLLAAGIAVALQDVIKNFVGGLTIFLAGLYKVGDRIEIDGRTGDVLDIGIMYTTLLETASWVEGDLASGRLTSVPNGVVLATKVNNSSKDYNFIWDEITIPVTFDSDWKAAGEKFAEIARMETAEISASASAQMSSVKDKDKYYLSERSVEPVVYMSLTDNWINISIRFTSDVKDRRILHSRISGLLLREIENSGGKIKIASQSIDVTITSPREEPRSSKKSKN